MPREDAIIVKMSAHPQYTVASSVTLEGVGLHTGQSSRVGIWPSDRGALVFHRNGDRIPAHLLHVSQTARCTTLGGAENGVSTVEHLLASLDAMDITSAEIRMDGPEVPALDGSAARFVESLLDAGRRALPSARRTLSISEPVWLSDNGAHMLALPAPHYRLTVAVDFPHPLIGRQVVDVVLSSSSFARELAPARTFGFAHELEELARLGLARGGSIENALVFTEDAITTPLRFPDEPARHKALDVVGDLALIGARPLIHLIATRPSHRLNIAFARLLIQQGTMT